MSPLYIAPDTDVLLHFRRPDLIDWADIARDRPVVLVFVPNTLREIEKHKDGLRGAGRERARNITAWLRKADAGTLSSKVSIEIRHAEPSTFGNGLDRDVPDDRFVASVAEVSSEGREIVALTNDFLLQQKLKAQGIRGIYPPASERLADEEDEVSSRLRKLEKIISERPAPQMTAMWASGQLALSRQLPLAETIPTPEEEADAVPRFNLVSQNRGYSEQWTIFLTEKRAPGFASRYPRIVVGERIAAEYNAKVDEYIKEYRRFYNQEEARLSRKSRTIELTIDIHNEGRLPASAPRIQLELSPELVIPTVSPPWGSQTAIPSPPGVPSGAGIIRMPSTINKAEHLYLGGMFDDPHGLKRKGDRSAEAKIPTLQHGDSYRLSTLKVIADAQAVGRSVFVKVIIRADELPEPEKRELRLSLVSS